MSEAPVQEFLAESTAPEDAPKSGPREMTMIEQTCADTVYASIQNASDNTDRARQAADFILGVSNLGHCRQHAVLSIRQTPPSDVRDKTAAFIGRVLGEAIEAQMKIDHPDWLFQTLGTFKLPSGGELDGHTDIVVPFSAATEEHPQGIWDLKSKDKLEVVKRYGQTKQQRYQLISYADAMIKEGLLNPDEPIWLVDVYFDRSGSTPECYAIGFWYDPADLAEIDEWVGDVIYAAAHGEDASRDMPREFCWKYCEYASLCRGPDTDVEGLITDPEIKAAVDMYREGLDKVSEGEKLKDQAKLVIPKDLSGSTGENNIRWIHVNEAEMKAYTRKAYDRIDVKPVPGPDMAKPKRKPRAKKA